MMYHNSWDEKYRTPFGAIATEQNIDILLTMPKDAYVENARVLVCEVDKWEEAVEYQMTWVFPSDIENTYKVSLNFSTPMTRFYCFKAKVNGVDKIVKRNWDNKGIMSNDIDSERFGTHWQLTVYPKGMQTPEELKGIMYQIFPDRFYASGAEKKDVAKEKVIRNDWGELPVYRANRQGIITNNDFFQGDIKGVQEKLDYLQSLGVTTIYLNPIFKAYSNHGYDTGDYMEIEPIKGTKQDFVELCAVAKEKGISIILDGVFSHTGSDSKYFNKDNNYDSVGAYQSKDSKYSKWYKFKDFPNKYACWWDFDTLPEIDKNNDDFVEFITGKDGVIDQWMSLGASGFRLDVVDELNDKILDKITAAVKKYGNKPVIGEVWEDASLKVAYGVRKKYFIGRQLDSVMNYPFKDAILNYVRYGGRDNIYYTVMTILENYPKPVINGLMNFLGTHDTERAITRLGAQELGNNGGDRIWQVNRQKLDEEQYFMGTTLFKLASILQFFLPGMPCIYYGDEAGLFGYKDPFNRTCYPWGKEDENLLDFFKTIGKIRIDLKDDLFDAKFSFVEVTSQICSFVRISNTKNIFVSINRTKEELKFELPSKFNGGKILFSLNGSDKKVLKPYGALIIESI
ncbi:MAG: glycoside hydrolase family 13 protein [Clostridia bacterium]